jgi:hypothetical protein
MWLLLLNLKRDKCRVQYVSVCALCIWQRTKSVSQTYSFSRVLDYGYAVAQQVTLHDVVWKGKGGGTKPTQPKYRSIRCTQKSYGRRLQAKISSCILARATHFPFFYISKFLSFCKMAQ